jgi:hypothetical protein
MVIDELPPEDRVRLIHYLIKQAGIYKETFRAQAPSRNPVSEPGSGG